MSIRVIIADNYAMFRAGIARFLVTENDLRIVGQYDDLARLYKAVETLTGGIVIFASSLEPCLADLIEKAKGRDTRFVAVLEKHESSQPFLRHNIDGIIYRDVGQPETLRCLRAVISGNRYTQKGSGSPSDDIDSDSAGQRVRERLSKKELQIIGLLLKGYKNKDIADELNNSEQVIKNYLRSIFDKTGVSDRLELALFTLHHRTLLDAVGTSGVHLAAMPSALSKTA